MGQETPHARDRPSRRQPWARGRCLARKSGSRRLEHEPGRLILLTGERQELRIT